ncbi:MAG: homoserine O-acetyltransferase [Pseudomonadota bacterium]
MTDAGAAQDRPAAAASAAVGSVGIVTPQTFVCETPLALQSGATLPRYELIYETYGTLNAAASNAILICHALSGHHHAAGLHAAEESKPGWWDTCIGPGKPIDTDRFFVVCPNNLGGCHGSTGPTTLNPATGKTYGPDFPTVTVKDWVQTQQALADHLGIHCFAAVLGGSLGGMQALQWAIDAPDRARAIGAIASAARLSAQNIAFNEIARQSIMSDPDFHDGRYAEHGKIPDLGLRLARMVGHVTYLSDDGMRRRFGRSLRTGDLTVFRDVEFQVESYLRHQGRSFSRRFDANTYILMTRALDYFDPAADCNDDLSAALSSSNARFLVASFSTDWRFSSARSDEIVDALIRARKNVVSVAIESEHGHDSFLLPIPRYLKVLSGFLNGIELTGDSDREPAADASADAR